MVVVGSSKIESAMSVSFEANGLRGWLHTEIDRWLWDGRERDPSQSKKLIERNVEQFQRHGEFPATVAGNSVERGRPPYRLPSERGKTRDIRRPGIAISSSLEEMPLPPFCLSRTRSTCLSSAPARCTANGGSTASARTGRRSRVSGPGGAARPPVVVGPGGGSGARRGCPRGQGPRDHGRGVTFALSSLRNWQRPWQQPGWIWA